MNKKLLKNKNYMVLMIGNFVSLMGSNIQQFVLSLYVLALTGSATLFASMLAISILPRILLSPLAGVFGDWFDKKKSIIILDTINALILGVFAVYMYLNGTLSIGLIYILVVLLEITEIFFHSSMSAVLPSVVEKEDYLEANSLKTMIVSFGQLMAPIFGALIYGAFGLLIALIVNGISFLISAISETFINVPKSKSEDNNRSLARFKKDFISGLKLIKESKAIRTIMSTAVVVNFSIAPLFSVGLIFLIKEVLQQSDMRLGLLQTVLSASMIIAPILLTKKLKSMRLGDVLIKGFMITGLLIMIISFSINESMMSVNNGVLSYSYILLICFFIGICATAVNISVNTLIQKIVPIEFMGRTSTVLGLFSTIAIPIGQMLFGFLYDIINPGIVFILNGFIIVLVVVFFYNRLQHIDEKDSEEVREKLTGRRVMVNEV